MRFPHKSIARVVAAFALVVAIGSTHAQSMVPLGNAVPGLSMMAVPMKSMREMRYQDMVRQGRDYTCGAAALATILQQLYGRATSEDEIILDMLAHTDVEVARARGFSLLDMKHYLDRVGLRGRGYQVNASALTTLKIPVIALQTTGGYAHFVVVKRVAHGIVYIADPALGNRQLYLDEFVAGWNGIVFAVLGDGRRTNNALQGSAKSLAAAQREDIVTGRPSPQQEFGLFGMDTF